MESGENKGLMIALAALAVMAVLFCMTRYADYDLWWHLKLGESIISNWWLPSVDTFSYTAAGRHQFTGEWLADAIIFLTFNSSGFIGLNLLKAALLILAFTFVFLQVRNSCGNRPGYAAAAVITLLLLLFAVRFRLFVRPYLFSLPLLAAYLYMIERWRTGKRGKPIYLLPLLMLLWANLSVGAVFGIFVLGVAVVVELGEHRTTRLLPVFCLTLLASLANPETWRLYTLTLGLTSDPYRTMVGEYQPITRDILFGSGLRYTLWFQLMAAGSLLYLALRKGWRDPFRVVLYLFFLYEAFRQVRLVEMFSLVVAPYFALLLAEGFSSRIPLMERIRPMVNYAAAACMLLLIPWTVFDSKVYAFGAGPKEGAFPERAIGFLEEQGIRGKLFNSYGFGGYLIWRGQGRQVFIDGRYRRLYTPEEYGLYKGIMESAGAWQAAQLKYGFDYAVLEYDMMSRRFPSHLLQNPDWALVYWDNYSLVYVKRTPERAAMIAEREYLLAKPAFLDFSYLDEYVKQGKLNEALGRLDREVALNPDNQFVVLARVYLRYQAGKMYLAQIREDLERILPLKPDFAMKHSALAMVLSAAGERERSEVELRRALKMDPYDAAALSLAKDFGIKVSIPKGAIPGHP